MFRSLFKRKNSVIFSWVMAFLMIILLFVAIFMIVFAQMQSSLKEEINESNSYIVDHAKMVVDSTISDFMTGAQVILDSGVDHAAETADEVVSVLKQVSALTADAEAVAILDIPSGQAYSVDGSMELSSYYETFCADNTRTYEEWLAMFDEDPLEFCYTTELAGANYHQRYINYVISLVPAERSAVLPISKCAVFTISEEKLLEKLSGIRNLSSSSLYVVDKDRRIILDSDERTLPIFPKEKLAGTYGMFNYRFEDGVQTVFYTQSAVADLTYISIFRDTQHADEINTMWYYCFAGLIIALLLGILLVWYFVKRNYMPIRNLIELFGVQNNKEESHANEYHALEAFIRRTIRSNALLDKQVDEQRRILRYRVLERILKGRPGHKGLPIAEELQQYDVVFPHTHFAVMLFFVEDNDGKEETYTYQETVFIISNVVEEMIGEQNIGVMTDCEGLIACVVNIKDENLNTISSMLKDVVIRANSFISKNFGISFTVSISSVVDSLEEVHDAYEEALDVMNYKESLGISETLCYDEIQDTGAQIYNYPFRMEQRLSNMIKSGNYEDAVQTIDSVFESNVEKNLDAPNVAQYIMISLISTISRTLNEISGDADGSVAAEMLPMDALLGCKTVPEMKEALHECLKTICQRMEVSSRQSENWIKKDVLPYIAENYSDVNMSVANIAERFGVHSVYLSRLFKEQIGEGMLEYITKFRIERAKEVLRNTRLMMDDVALKVGYNNARTFSRAFKKTEGITPGKYREIHS